MDHSLRPGEPTPPIFEPSALLMYHWVDGRNPPFMLIAGDHWLLYENGAWTINADEPATEADVAALLIESGGVTTWWGV